MPLLFSHIVSRAAAATADRSNFKIMTPPPPSETTSHRNTRSGDPTHRVRGTDFLRQSGIPLFSDKYAIAKKKAESRRKLMSHLHELARFWSRFCDCTKSGVSGIDFRRCLMINHTKLRYDFAVGKTVFVCVYQYTTKLRLKRSPTTVLERTLS